MPFSCFLCIFSRFPVSCLKFELYANGKKNYIKTYETFQTISEMFVIFESQPKLLKAGQIFLQQIFQKPYFECSALIKSQKVD